MAEGIMRKLYGKAVYVQSVGVKSEQDIDGFAVAVCHEIGVELAQHRARSFDEMEALGEDISGFDLVIALSPASRARAEAMTRFAHVDLEFWPIFDPTAAGDGREARLEAYRKTRDQIIARMQDRFGPPRAGETP